jgi:hypothetical protein
MCCTGQELVLSRRVSLLAADLGYGLWVGDVGVLVIRIEAVDIVNIVREHTAQQHT